MLLAFRQRRTSTTPNSTKKEAILQISAIVSYQIFKNADKSGLDSRLVIALQDKQILAWRQPLLYGVEKDLKVIGNEKDNFGIAKD